jgi:hypothetical protein
MSLRSCGLPTGQKIAGRTNLPVGQNQQDRHCERSEAIHLTAQKKEWIASSQTLLAMTASTQVPSMIDHVSVGVSNLGESARFYELALAPLGLSRLVTRPATIPNSGSIFAPT